MNASCWSDGNSRRLLCLVLSIAIAARLWILLSYNYIIWPDETFQYLEPAHRLIFGSGVVTWEFVDGVRSWLLPGIVAVVMWLASRLSDQPATFIFLIRVAFGVASLSIPYAGFKLTQHRCGSAAAFLVGTMCALYYDNLYFSSAIMAEPLATDMVFLAMRFADTTGTSQSVRRARIAAGLLFGLAAAIRFQYIPTIMAVVLIQHTRSPRELIIVAFIFLTVILLLLGGLDLLVWGKAFQSVWLNYERNEVQGVSSAMGVEAWNYYLSYYILAWGLLAPVLLTCALAGTSRLPAMAAVVFCTISLHSFIPHKEVRFVFLATAGMPILLGIGISEMFRMLPSLHRFRDDPRIAGVLGGIVAGYIGISTFSYATPADAWHRRRSVSQVTEDARTYPEICGLGIRDVRVYLTGGYTYWHRQVPIYFAMWDDAQRLPNTSLRLALQNVFDRHVISQYSDAEFANHSDKFNIMVASPDDGLPGFTRRACYGSGTVDDPRYCVFVRSGPCQ